MRIRVLTIMLALSTSIVGLAPSAHAATIEERVAVAATWTQPDSSSRAAWDAARADQAAWSDYAFDWSTDYCSNSPNRPLGFDFTLSCARHDFGYRNFKQFNAFSENKGRIDDAFYFDMKQACDGYFDWKTCYAVAWTYYQAVHVFGSVSVSKEQLDQIAQRNGHPELNELTR